MQLPLPNELVDSIIDNLHSDIASLLECALVGRAWARSSQRGIFRQIVLNPFLRTDDYLKTTERLVAAFDAQPRLESYVRSLELRGFWSTNTRVDAATASVVQRLANMNDLTLSSINWTVLSPMLKAKLTGIFQSPSLRQVFSRDLHMPAFAELASLLACARHLKVLGLSADCVDSTLPTEIASTAPRSIRLEEVRLAYYPHFIDWFLQDSCPFEVRNLQSLCLYGHFPCSGIIGLMQYIGGNLRNLKMSLRLSKAEECENRLKHTPNLRTLHLAYLDQGITLATPVPKIQALFRPLLGQDRNRFPLQHFIIELGLKQASQVENHPWGCWSAIDALFEKPEFALLETVDFRLHGWGGCKVPSGAMELLREQLPFLEQSEKLRIQIR